jgi:hypothetical protein
MNDASDGINKKLGPEDRHATSFTTFEQFKEAYYETDGAFRAPLAMRTTP